MTVVHVPFGTGGRKGHSPKKSEARWVFLGTFLRQTEVSVWGYLDALRVSDIGYSIFLKWWYACGSQELGAQMDWLLVCTMNLFGCFLKWWYPPNTPKWSCLVGKPKVVGYHHFRKPPFDNNRCTTHHNPTTKYLYFYLINSFWRVFKIKRPRV